MFKAQLPLSVIGPPQPDLHFSESVFGASRVSETCTLGRFQLAPRDHEPSVHSQPGSRAEARQVAGRRPAAITVHDSAPTGHDVTICDNADECQSLLANCELSFGRQSFRISTPALRNPKGRRATRAPQASPHPAQRPGHAKLTSCLRRAWPWQQAKSKETQRVSSKLRLQLSDLVLSETACWKRLMCCSRWQIIITVASRPSTTSWTCRAIYLDLSMNALPWLGKRNGARPSHR